VRPTGVGETEKSDGQKIKIFTRYIIAGAGLNPASCFWAKFGPAKIMISDPGIFFARVI
jgi:hypothetical protein